MMLTLKDRNVIRNKREDKILTKRNTSSYKPVEKEQINFDDFFNFAPVGYFILNHQGIVEDINEKGTQILLKTKKDIINQQFQSFIPADGWTAFYSFLHKMKVTSGNQCCELKLFFPLDETEIYIKLEGIAAFGVMTNELQYYITLNDISKSKLEQRKIFNTSRRLIRERQKLKIQKQKLGNIPTDAYAKYVLLQLRNWK